MALGCSKFAYPAFLYFFEQRTNMNGASQFEIIKLCSPENKFHEMVFFLQKRSRRHRVDPTPWS